MAEFEKCEKVWVPYLCMTLSAGETDALNNLIREWVLARKPWELSSQHQTMLVNMHTQMNKPGGPLA
jgi:hypothetical protein